MTRAWTWYLAFLITASGPACSTNHQAPGPATGVCLDEPAKVEEQPVESGELAENDVAPAEADECVVAARADRKAPLR